MKEGRKKPREREGDIRIGMEIKVREALEIQNNGLKRKYL